MKTKTAPSPRRARTDHDVEPGGPPLLLKLMVAGDVATFVAWIVYSGWQVGAGTVASALLLYLPMVLGLGLFLSAVWRRVFAALVVRAAVPLTQFDQRAREVRDVALLVAVLGVNGRRCDRDDKQGGREQ